MRRMRPWGFVDPACQANQKFKITTSTATATATGTGRLYQFASSSCLSLVNPYTRPSNSESARGSVIRLTRIVTRKQVVQALIAIQKFCAMEEGKLWT